MPQRIECIFFQTCLYHTSDCEVLQLERSSANNDRSKEKFYKKMESRGALDSAYFVSTCVRKGYTTMSSVV